MMYRLLLADDEVEPRLALSRYYPWRDIGFEVVGQAENAISHGFYFAAVFVQAEA